jgi:hypothetical protein
MENSRADSSSESDVSDTWSVMNNDPVEPHEIPADTCDGNSSSGEPSDAESFEVIDEEEEKDQDDCK